MPTFFVSGAVASSGNGTSWATAWKDTTNIVWASVTAGSTIFLDGGTTTSTISPYDFSGSPNPGVDVGMNYSAFTVGSSNITIQRSREAGRNGTVVIFGGRSVPLPYCGQVTYTAANGTSLGINCAGVTGVTIDGMDRSGIIVRGHQNGLKPGTNGGNTFRNLELFDNGFPTSTGTGPAGGTFNSDGNNILSAGNNTYDRCLIHDGGQDQFHSDAGGTGSDQSNTHVTYCWMGAMRAHPSFSYEPYNDLQVAGFSSTHADAWQTFAPNGLTMTGLTFDHCIIGPGVNQGVYPNDSGTLAHFENVNITNTLFLGCVSHNIECDQNVHGWNIDHCTFYAPRGAAFEMPGDGNSVMTNCIKFGGTVYDPGMTWTGSAGNVWFNGDALPAGAVNANPNFVTTPPIGNIAIPTIFATDLTPTGTFAGTGSPLHSMNDLLNTIDALNGTATGSLLPAGIPGNWNLTFDDEFPGPTLDSTKWRVDTWNANNVTFSGANIIMQNPGVALQVASATSGAQIETIYNLPVGGCCEARVWFPGPGAPTPGNTINNWPAWWTSSNNLWPAGGEIDIAESYNGTLTNNYFSSSGAHNGPVPGPAGNWSNSYHTYGMLRGPTAISYYFDGVLVHTYSPTDDTGAGHSLLLTAGSGNTAVFGTASYVKASYVRAWVPVTAPSDSESAHGTESQSVAIQGSLSITPVAGQSGSSASGGSGVAGSATFVSSATASGSGTASGITNSFEGGSDTTAITLANSGGASGNAFDTVFVSGAGASVTFSATHPAHGSLGMHQVHAAGVNCFSYAGWTTSFGTQTTFWYRMYMYLPANPTVNTRIAQFNTGAGRLILTTAGKLVFADGAGVTAVTTTNSVPLNTLFRIEGKVVCSGTLGQAEVKLFNTPDSATATETQLSTSTFNTGTGASTYVFGDFAGSIQTVTWNAWYDDVGLSNTGYLGPVGGQVPLPISVPSGVQDGDYIFFLLTSNSLTAPVFPAGVTTLASGQALSGTSRSYALGYRAALSEPASYSVGITGPSDCLSYAVRGLTGVPAVTSAIENGIVANTFIPSPTASLGAPSDCTLYAYTGYTVSGSGVQTITYPPGLTNGQQAQSASLGDITAIAMAQPGVTGRTTATVSTGIIYADFMIDVATAGSAASALLSNSFDSGTSGTAFTQGAGGNTGDTSGDAFDVVSVVSGGTAAFSNAHVAHGTLAAQFSTGVTSGVAMAQWSASSVGSRSTLYGRAYVYLTGNPATDDAIVSFAGSSNGNAGEIIIGATGQLRLQSAAFVQTGGGPIMPLNQWFRLEWKIICGVAGAASATLNYYSSLDSSIITNTLTDVTNAWGAGGIISQAQWGWTGGHANQPAMYLDSIGLSATGFLGPVTGSTSITAALPAGITQGNLVVACLTQHAQAVVTPPANWAQAGAGATLSSLTTGVYYLPVGAGDTGNTSFTFSFSTPVTAAVTIREWHSSTGWPVAPVDNSHGAAASGSTAITTGSVITTAASDLLVAALSWADTSETEGSLTAGFTSGLTNASSGACTVREAYFVTGAAGSFSCTETLSAAANTIGVLAAFSPVVSSSVQVSAPTDTGHGAEGLVLVSGIRVSAPSDTGQGAEGPASVTATSGILPKADSDTGQGADGTGGVASSSAGVILSGSLIMRRITMSGSGGLAPPGTFLGFDFAQGLDSQSIRIIGPSTTIGLVQSNAVNSGTTPEVSQAITLGTPVVLGDLLVACVTCGDNTAVTGAPAGWALAVNNLPAGPNATIQASIWYMAVTPSTVGQVSWTFTVTASSTMALTMSEWHSSTGWAVSPLDQVAQGNTQSSPSASTTVDSGTTSFTTNPVELCIASLAYRSSQPIVSNNFIVAANSPGGLVSMAELYQVTSSAGSEDCTLSIGATPQYWAGCIATFMPFTTVVSSPGHPVSQDAGFGTESWAASGIGAGNAFKLAPPDTGQGQETQAVSSFGLLADSDTGTGSDAQRFPGSLPVQAADFSIGSDAGGIAGVSGGAVAPPLAGPIFEGFSLARASLLGASGLENARLYGAQSISIVPNVTASDMRADDDELNVWYSMNKASITVTNGFMSWTTIASLSGINVVGSGLSPNDYYGLPLWTQYQHNKAAVSMAFRMFSKDSQAAVRTLDFVLYKVQLSVIDYTGIAYKQGLGVSYAGTVLFSITDEAGNTLPSLRIGRIVSSSGNLSGSLGPVPFRGRLAR